MAKLNRSWFRMLVTTTSLVVLLSVGSLARAQEPQSNKSSWIRALAAQFVAGSATLLVPLPPEPEPEEGTNSGETPIPEEPELPAPLPEPELPAEVPDIPGSPEPGEEIQSPPEQTPEPATILSGLVGLGVAGLVAIRRRHRKS